MTFYYLFKGLFYIAVLYYLWMGLGILGIIFHTHIINKKYWGYVLTTIVGAVLLIISYVSDDYILVLGALAQPFLMRKIFGGEPNLNPNKIQISNRKSLNDLYGEGINLGESGKYLEAIEIFDNVLGIDPKYVDVLASKAYVLCHLHKYEEAIAVCNKALEIDPNNMLAFDNFMYVGVCLAESGKYLEAIEIFDRGLGIDSKNMHALNSKATALTRLYKNEEALVVCNKALEYAPQNLYALNNKAAALTNLHKYQEAMEIFDYILKIDPKNVDAIKNKGRCPYVANLILDREFANDKARVGEYVLHFLKENSFCRELMSDHMQEISSNGFLEMLSKARFNEAPQTTNIIPWFMGLIFNELSQLKDLDKAQFKKLLDHINKYDVACLERSYQLTLKYGLNPEDMKKDYKKWLNGIKDENDKVDQLFSFFSDGIFHSEAIILTQVYEDWYKEKYTFEKN